MFTQILSDRSMKMESAKGQNNRSTAGLLEPMRHHVESETLTGMNSFTCTTHPL